jgi:hypothetical protein
VTAEALVPHIGGSNDHSWRSDCGGCIRIDRGRAYRQGYTDGIAASRTPAPLDAAWCPEFDGPGDCTCGLYALLDSIRCVCGHKVNVHTDRHVDDTVGWPCNGCKSALCSGFALAERLRGGS